MARAIRTLYYLRQHGMKNSNEYEKQIYIQNKQWHPPPVPLEIEEGITKFEKILKEKQKHLLNKTKNMNLTNLTTQQKNVFRQLSHNQEIIIKPTDKNLGPAVMDIKTYVSQVLQEHLLTNTYRQLSSTETKNYLEEVNNNLKNIILANKDKLSAPEFIYFERSFKGKYRLPIFYGLPKVHKTPVTLHLVVSSVNSFMALFSNWLDYRMKQLLPLVRSYTKNSFDIIQDLKQLDIPNKALLFSADAKSMYTNINSDIGIQSIQAFIASNQE